VEQVTSVSIYPEKDEPESILNIKRGIISALLVPVLEEEHNKKMVRLKQKFRVDTNAVYTINFSCIVFLSHVKYTYILWGSKV